jgi:uncharacterized phage protein (TIGR01671 family)
MREIKFEYGFESVNGIVKKVYALSEIPNIKEKCDVWNVLPVIYVRQFTGLQDKNGVDIYVGDILDNGYNAKGMVYFKNGMFVVNFTYTETLLTKDNQTAFFRLCNVNMVTKIIGNIHEHPNLLK